MARKCDGVFKRGKVWRLDCIINGRVKEGAAVRPNRELPVLRNLLNKVIKYGEYEGDNPVRQFAPLKKSRGRDRILDPAEGKRLLAKA